ncbi:hypothetical protein [Paraburkholderia sp. MM5384-R2]|uniref:hypothetical protein n=1 Tax=Paraburkholderia sp. MM5384-R2 TaxID=2723097 RepID=UPI001618E995|nr:hypothetical protein [Paraburkholderia sp. MM5384-R2]MBB5501236.1 hypothetical protein [Paraburkholderia sp. MM5384-R2]
MALEPTLPGMTGRAQRTGRHFWKSAASSPRTAVAEYILDFYSTIQEHERLLTSQKIPSWDEWKSFIADGFRDAPFLCHYFEQNASWYEEGLMKIYGPVARERQELIIRQRSALSRGTK